MVNLGFDPIDYYDALYGPSKAQVSLHGGRTLTLRRVGLGRHFHLRAVGQEIGTVSLDQRVDRLRAWLKAAGIDPEGLALDDLPMVIVAVKQLNVPRGQLAWTVFRSDDGSPPDRRYTDYPGRELARIVDTLARHYGWSPTQILELPPEVALAHVQECVLADYRRQRWEHQLSEIAWEYNKSDGKSHYKPLPPLPWERSVSKRDYEPVPEWVKEKYYPKGVIVDLTSPQENGR
jgi:hypothetical protein